MNITIRRRPIWRRCAVLAMPAAMVLGVAAFYGANGATALPVQASNVASNSASFTYDPEGGKSTAISALEYTRASPGVLMLTVFGTPVQDRPEAVISADLVNQTPSLVSFAPGAVVWVTIQRDGRPWKSVHLPVTGELELLGQRHLQTIVALDRAGHYDLSGQLLGPGSMPAFSLYAP